MSQRLRTGRDALNDAGRALMDLGEELGWHAQELTASVLLVAPGDPAHSFTVDLPPERKWRANKAEQKRAMLFEHGDQLKVAAWHARHPKPGPPLKITAQPSVFVKPEPEIAEPEVAAEEVEPTQGEVPEGRYVMSMTPAISHERTGSRDGGKAYEAPCVVVRLWSDGSVDFKCSVVDCDWHVRLCADGEEPAPRDRPKSGWGEPVGRPLDSVSRHFGRSKKDGRHDPKTAVRHYPHVPFPEEKKKTRGPRRAPEYTRPPQVIELDFAGSVKSVESVITEPVEELDTLAEIVRLVHERGLCELPAVQAELRATRTELEDMKALFALSEEENKEIPVLQALVAGRDAEIAELKRRLARVLEVAS